MSKTLHSFVSVSDWYAINCYYRGDFPEIVITGGISPTLLV